MKWFIKLVESKYYGLAMLCVGSMNLGAAIKLILSKEFCNSLPHVIVGILCLRVYFRQYGRNKWTKI